MSKVIKSTEPDAGACAHFERDPLEELVPALLAAAYEAPEVAAGRLLAEAREQAEARIQEGYEQGYAQGLERGEAAARAEFEEAVAGCAEALTRAGEAMGAARQAFLDALEPEVARLAGIIARRILHREAEADPEVVGSTVRAALENLVGRERLTVRLNPGDVNRIREQGVRLLDEFDGAEVSVVGDESVDVGGCIVETESVKVDARLEAQLQQIVDAMLG
ncbi:MAG: hypothetical protein JXR94_13875 [Candidatus Hydrogenedentes bacterium]|nr:hypothetical protein [Candidatus Hydrogenedentota bacterium]